MAFQKVGNVHLGPTGRVKNTKQAAEYTPRVVITRHPATAYNNSSPERIRGWQDVPLDETGKKQIQPLIDKLVAEFPEIDEVYSSDLSRAADVASPLSKKAGCKVLYSRSLRPWKLGDMEGKPPDEAALKELANNPSQRAPGGESINDFLNRYLPVFEKILKRAASGCTCVIVTHSRNVRASLALLDMYKNGNLDLAVIYSKDNPVDPGHFISLVYKNNKWSVERKD